MFNEPVRDFRVLGYFGELFLGYNHWQCCNQQPMYFYNSLRCTPISASPVSAPFHNLYEHARTHTHTLLGIYKILNLNYLFNLHIKNFQSHNIQHPIISISSFPREPNLHCLQLVYFWKNHKLVHVTKSKIFSLLTMSKWEFILTINI